MKKRYLPWLYLLLLFMPICGLLYLGMRSFGIEPLAPHLCLNSSPSEASVVQALRYGSGDGVPGVGDDGIVYRLKRLDCPRGIAVSTPKMSMHLSAESDGILLTEGELYIGVINSHQVVIFNYKPTEPVSLQKRQHYPALQVFLKRYVR